MNLKRGGGGARGKFFEKSREPFSRRKWEREAFKDLVLLGLSIMHNIANLCDSRALFKTQPLWNKLRHI